MDFKVEVISKVIIKPSAPTPDHLGLYKLSFLDQLSPAVYNPLVFFYDNLQLQPYQITEISDKLKKSLSEALTLFYPLSGRVRDNLFVDCNDKGIPFLEARVHKCQLSDVITNPIPGELNKLLPFKLDQVAELALGVQLNIFECGGIGIGACISHQLGDALSYFMFIKTWALIAFGKTEIVSPEFVSSKLFPPKPSIGYDQRIGITKNNIISKRFVFHASAIEALRSKYEEFNCKSLGDQKRPSRVEALSSFIWKCFVSATKNEEALTITNKFYSVLHAVNLRPWFDPPLPEHSFGNLYRIAMTTPICLRSDDEECYGLLMQVRDEIRKIDKEFVRTLQQGDEHLNLIMDGTDKFMKGELVTFSFTSLCRFPIYKADFGWGKPIWVGSPALTFQNLVVFMDTKMGDGIEAYISLKNEDMDKLEADQEFFRFVNFSSSRR